MIKEFKSVWKDGKEHTVYRDEKGHFAKNPQSKIIPETTRERISPRQEVFYRASVFVEIPYHDEYKWFGIIQIDYQENISIGQLKQEVIELLEDELHYSKSEFWFDITYSIEYPHPYDAYQPSKHKETWSLSKP